MGVPSLKKRYVKAYLMHKVGFPLSEIKDSYNLETSYPTKNIKPVLKMAYKAFGERLLFQDARRFFSRNHEIYELRQQGATLSAIAEAYGLTRERIRQICHREGRRRAASPSEK